MALGSGLPLGLGAKKKAAAAEVPGFNFRLPVLPTFASAIQPPSIGDPDIEKRRRDLLRLALGGRTHLTTSLVGRGGMGTLS